MVALDNGRNRVIELSTPARRLRSDQKTLTQMGAQVRAARRVRGDQRTKALRGGSFLMILEGLKQLRGDVAAERGRIAYEAAHPGLLPAE